MTALIPDEIRQLLRECAVVIRPGETLVLRVPDDFTPNQVRQYMDGLESLIKHMGWGFSVLPVMAKELAVLHPEEPEPKDGRPAENTISRLRRETAAQLTPLAQVVSGYPSKAE